ncbi:hypothetical protein KC19_VG203700 [Ceratodon purpureus]|uniref:Uncharacterized protein n=1 Tax=Ceratodon purpureus TaxID=3225 RepID=A0A8T0HSH6_CERPU|nr:hypothetical protein KC19_VG203700 [Ceratodon purpureus]
MHRKPKIPENPNQQTLHTPAHHSTHAPRALKHSLTLTNTLKHSQTHANTDPSLNTLKCMAAPKPKPKCMTSLLKFYSSIQECLITSENRTIVDVLQIMRQLLTISKAVVQKVRISESRDVGAKS